jgi:hypothetical protein
MRKFIWELSTGGYEQGTGSLKRDGKFCCLGVACMAAVKNGVEIDVTEEGPADPLSCPCGLAHSVDGPRTMFDGESGFLPSKVADWLGLELGDGETDASGDAWFGPDNNRTNPVLAGLRATSWNDDYKTPFPAIAQLFRHEFLGHAA